MGRKKKSAAAEAAVKADADEIIRQILESIDAEGEAEAPERAMREIQAARAAVKWAHLRFAVSAKHLAAFVEAAFVEDSGPDSMTPEDVGEHLKEVTRHLKHLKAVIEMANDAISEATVKAVEEHLRGLD